MVLGPDPGVWLVKEDQQSLSGVMWRVEWNAGPYVIGCDGDWVFHITPDPEYAHLATNSMGDLNFAGSDGRDVDPPQGSIQCEIQPRENNEDTFKVMTRGMLGRQVQIVGPLVEDTKHRGPNEGGRTEIHPVTSVLLVDAVPNKPELVVTFLAFSDAGGISPTPFGKTAYPPHAHTDREASFTLAWPGRPSPMSKPIYRVGNLIQASNWLSATYQKLGPDESPSLSADVHTGTPDEGKGMYGAVITLTWS